MNPGPASFDPAKLVAFQAHYMQELPLAEKVGAGAALPAAGGLAAERAVDDATRARVARIVEALGDRLKVFGDILLQAGFFFGEEVTFDDKAFAKRVLAPGAAERLAEYRQWLAGRQAFDAASLERDTQAWLAERGLGLGDIVHAVRVAVTGHGGGPGAVREPGAHRPAAVPAPHRSRAGQGRGRGRKVAPCRCGPAGWPRWFWRRRMRPCPTGATPAARPGRRPSSAPKTTSTMPC